MLVVVLKISVFLILTGFASCQLNQIASENEYRQHT